jgi:hypothetical protein
MRNFRELLSAKNVAEVECLLLSSSKQAIKQRQSFFLFYERRESQLSLKDEPYFPKIRTDTHTDSVPELQACSTPSFCTLGDRWGKHLREDLGVDHESKCDGFLPELHASVLASVDQGRTMYQWGDVNNRSGPPCAMSMWQPRSNTSKFAI